MGISRVFIVACMNDSKYYLYIIKRYAALKFNLADADHIRDFMIRYLETHPTLLGLKLALYSHVYHNYSADMSVLSTNYKEDILRELKEKGLVEEAKLIEGM